MSKLCSVCGTENRDEAQFCRACGTAFSAAKAAAATAADGSADNVCVECGFQNKPGIRYCANCGMSLAGAAADPGGDAATPSADEAYGSGSPPPITYQSFATVSPYPTAQDSDHSALFDQQAPPDIPDPDAALALRQQEGYQSHGDTTVTFQNPPAPNRAPLILGIVLALLALAGVAAWLFMGSSKSAPPVVAPAPPIVTPPVAATPAPPPTAAPIIVEEPASANAPTPAASAAAPATATAPPAATIPLGTPPAAAAPLPQLGDPAVESADAEAKRLAAEKRKEKVAKDKAERDAKAKVAADQSSTAAAQRSEQEAVAKRRAEEGQRARPSAAPAATPPPAPVGQGRGVREICAGRGTIAEAVCQSRQCGLAEHANEQICRQLRDADERRRNMQN
jgi:Double zinc ribbon